MFLIVILFANLNLLDLKSPQFLEYKAEWCLPRGECFLLEVANTKKEKMIGLMMRATIARGTGMWFVFSPPEVVKFTMYKTLIPLDMIFILNQLVVAIEADVPICLSTSCPNYGPDYAIDGVIELSAGEAERLKIKVGDYIDIQRI